MSAERRRNHSSSIPLNWLKHQLPTKIPNQQRLMLDETQVTPRVNETTVVDGNIQSVSFRARFSSVCLFSNLANVGRHFRCRLLLPIARQRC